MADVWGLVAANLAAIWWHRLSIEDRQSCDLVAVSINRGSAAGDQRVTATQRGVAGLGWQGWLGGAREPALFAVHTCTSLHCISIVFYTWSCML